MSNKILIIAEAGVNHNGDINQAKRLIEIASEAGADYVKFQTFKASRQVTLTAEKANYQKKTTDSAYSQHEMLSRLELTDKMHHELLTYCGTCNIGFLSTGFDIESVNFLMRLGQEYIKIPSGEITNLPYLRHIGQLGKKIILSTGMSTLGEVESAIDVIECSGTARDRITILHCSTDYPAAVKDVNLRAMQSMHLAFGVAVGYSDHTQGIEVAIAAAAMGATILEKHFTLDRNLPGPDHKASLEPAELIAMVAAIRNIEVALGDGVKHPTESELKNKSSARKSIVASRAIKVGELFTIKNITTKRPGTGISPMQWDDILGKKAVRDFEIDELIQL
jgi:N,N'-diacetyllegionaminate synthase